MAGEPAEPPPSGPEPEIERDPKREPEQANEHVGPLAIARHVKDDGRALVIYTRDAPAPT